MGAALAIRPRAFAAPIARAIGTLTVIIVTAVITYMFTAQLNVETATQQQNTAAVQQFEQSGAQMDASLSLYVDALLDKRGIADAKAAARASITLHASHAPALEALTGTGNVGQYVEGLGELRELADAVDGPATAKKMAQQHVTLMAYRKKLTALAKSNIYK